MTAGTLSAPVPLAEGHALEMFDCGEVGLNEWLKKRALRNNIAGASRTYVVCHGKEVVGYYCLAAGAIGHKEAPKALRRNMPDPVPVLVLGRLAVHKNYHNRGIGSALLRDALLRALQASTIAGVAALLVHALSEPAKRFYLSRGFLESPVNPMTLCVMLATVEKE